MWSCILGCLAIALLVGLVNAERTRSPARILLFKTPLSLLFIVTWGLVPYQNASISYLVGSALGCCFIGDMLLAFRTAKTFLMGLVLFLLGHGLFAGAFFISGSIGSGMAMGVVIVVVTAGLIWQWLAPHLGAMSIPALAYLVVISIMVCGAWSIFLNVKIGFLPRMGILTGAVWFYLSDIAVARQRFVISDHRNRIAGLPIYYGAQFMLAFSSAGITI